MKIKVLFGRPCLGEHRQEVANTLLEVERVSSQFPWMEVDHCPIERFPTSVARNLLIQTAQQQHHDIVFMTDSDMFPAEGFFKAAIDFLIEHRGPAAIASPYVTGAPVENVCVFEWGADRSAGNAPALHSPFALLNIVREDAARRTGIERVANAGTGYIAYKTTCFENLPHPYFDYGYSDKTHTKVTETEDCWAHRLFWEHDIPLFVSWDHWSMHRKSYFAQKPVRLTNADAHSVFLKQARAEVALGGKELAALVPKDVPGWCDFADLYDMAVREAEGFSRFVEVGSWRGQSAILMARLIKRSGKKILFTCVDHFRGSAEHAEMGEDCTGLREIFEANLDEHKVADAVQVLPLASVEAAKTFANESLDFVFLDGSHDEDSVRADIEAWLPKVTPKGILAGHDFDFFGVNRAVGKSLPGLQVRIMGRSWIYRKEETP